MQPKQLEHLKLAVKVSGVEVSDVVLPEDRELRVGNLRLHYLDWGNEHRPPLVFLHGGALTAHTWDVVCLALRDHYHCLALDQRGHGDSDWADDYSHERHCEDIEGFIDQLGIDRTVLVGQSMGGLNSIVYAGRGASGWPPLVIVDVGPELNMAGTKPNRRFSCAIRRKSNRSTISLRRRWNSIRAATPPAPAQPAA